MNVTPDDIPKKVGRYEIIESIGFGAMGAVYKALDPLIDRTVAIKTIRLDVPPDSPHYQTFLQRFYTEARISGTLSHPNVVTLFDIGETDDKIPFLAMEYIDGETIADMLASRERLHPEQVVALVSQMAAAIDYAHGKGVIHRDIKPSNVIVYDGEKVKVTDFGIAKLMDTEGTQTASLLGTPSYMSPEQAMGEELDGRTDIFSLGVVAFEMLSGQQPFPGNNVTSILYKLVHSDPVRPTNLEVLGLLPDKWHVVFSKVLAKSPLERYQTAAEFVSNLELCLGSWFGALEGETVVMTSPEMAALNLEKPESESQASAGALPEDSEETILLRGSDTKADITPVSEKPPAYSETLPPFSSDELETVLLKPTPDESDTRTMEQPTEPAVSEEPTVRPTASTEPGVPETETIALSPGEARAIVPKTGVTDATQVPSGEEETLAVLTPESLVPEDQPVTARNVKWLGSSKHLPWVVFAAAALVAIVLGTLVWMGGAPEAPPPFQEPSPVEPPPIAGSLTVRSTPEGATVLVDGEGHGVTPLELAQLAWGIYTVRIEKEGFKPQEFAADINEEEAMFAIDVALEPVAASAPSTPVRALLDIQSTPSEAQVFMDGKVIGRTPIERFRAPPGRRALLIQKEGFKPWETSIEVVAGVSGTVSATLEAVEEEPPPPPPKTPAAPEVKFGDLVERGPDVIDPKCIECPNVPYPELAKNARLEGIVEVSFIVTETGAVQDIRVEESAGDVFDPAVITVLMTWRYEPATKRGIPVKVRLSRRFRFRRGR